jgi:hypothetical protein
VGVRKGGRVRKGNTMLKDYVKAWDYKYNVLGILLVCVNCESSYLLSLPLYTESFYL